MTSAAAGDTYPAAGVIATSPAISPETTPSAVAFLRCTHSMTSHASAAAPAARCVVVTASAATAPLDGALPALKPSHPNQRRPAPLAVIVRLCGIARWRG